MMTNDDYDYWTRGSLNAPSEVPATPALTIETIEGVEPIDVQFGVAEPLTVPAVLHDALFGQPEPTEAELAAHGGDPTRVPPLNTYAILDAAKVQGLPEMLDTSGLPYRCLFKGAAYDELRDAAPWIVLLEEGNTFTRNLFTHSDAPWHIWDKEPGIYIRSRGTLDDLWKHFRKFTKVQDENGKWFYQRFYEPTALTEFAGASVSPFRATDDVHFSSVIALAHGVATVVYPQNVSVVPSAPFLDHQDRYAHDVAVERRFSRYFGVSLMACLGAHTTRLALRSTQPVITVVDGITQDLKSVSFRRRSDIGRIAAMAVFYGRYFLNDPRVRPVAQDILTDTKRAASIRALRFEQAVSARPFHQFVTSDEGLRAVRQDLTAGSRVLSRQQMTVWGLDDPDLVRAFDQCCLLQQERNHLPPADTNDHRWAHATLARLWTPFFLDDPLHVGLRQIFADTQKPILPRLLVELNARLTRTEEDA